MNFFNVMFQINNHHGFERGETASFVALHRHPESMFDRRIAV